MGKRLLILGAGGHSSVVAEVIQSLQDDRGKAIYETIDYLDDNLDKVIGKISDLETIGKSYDEVFCGIGNNKIRGEIIEKAMGLGMTVPVIIHPSAYVSPSAVIKSGTLVEPRAIVNTNSIVNEGCIISIGSIIDHDVRVEKYCHVNAGAICKAGSMVEAGRKLEAGEVVMGY